MPYTTWLIVAAVLAGLGVLRGARDGRERSTRLWSALAVAAGALLAGRIGFVALHAAYFAEQPGQVLGDGAAGFSEHAAWMGGWLAWRLAGRRLVPADLAMAGLLLAAAASMGCAGGPCAYGREVYPADGLGWWLRVDWPDAYGIPNPRLPTQAFAAIWFLGGVLVCGRCAPVRSALPALAAPAGLDVIAVATLWFAVGDSLLQVARSDPAPIWAGLRAFAWLDGILVISAAVALLRPRRSA